MKHSRKLTILIGCIVTVIGLAIVAVAVPATMTDGTENYTRAEKRAAQSALSFAQALSTSAPVPQFLKARVDALQPADPSDDRGAECNFEFDAEQNENVPERYTINVSHRWFFGVTSEIVTFHGCAYNLHP